MLGSHRLRAPHRAVAAFLARSEDQFSTEHLQHLSALDRNTVRHENRDRVTLHLRNRRQRNAGVARRRFNDALARLKRSVLLGLLDHLLGDAILNRAERVLAFELGDDAHFRVRREAADIDQRRIADQVEHTVVDHRDILIRGPFHRIPINLVDNLTSTDRNGNLADRAIGNAVATRFRRFSLQADDDIEPSRVGCLFDIGWAGVWLAVRVAVEHADHGQAFRLGG
jgi:hypothetical protein